MTALDSSEPQVRCDRCRFWEPNDVDDEHGFCKRNAPRPSFGNFEFAALFFLWSLAGSKGEYKWQEPHNANSIWPTTRGEEWCGEYQAAALEKNET